MIGPQFRLMEHEDNAEVGGPFMGEMLGTREANARNITIIIRDTMAGREAHLAGTML